MMGAHYEQTRRGLWRFGPLLPVALLLLVVFQAELTRAAGPSGWPAVRVADDGDDPRLAQAGHLFEQAEYDSALVVLEALAAEEALPVELRQATFRLLGLVHTVKGDPEAAKAAIRRWIATEPPVVTADPDRDLLEFVRLYYAVRLEFNEKHYCPADFGAFDPCRFIIGRPDPGVQTVAVVDFDNHAIDDRDRLAPLSGGLPDLMIRQLNGTIGLKIVEREWLDWLLDEIELSQTGVIDEQTALRIGRLIGAHSVLLGDYLYFNDTFTLGVRLVKVETGEVLLVASREGRLRDFGKIAGKLSEELARAIGTEIPEWEGRTPTQDLGAMLSYAEGLALYDEGKYEAAAEKFEEALVYDPNHAPARQRYIALRPVIAGVGTRR